MKRDEFLKRLAACLAGLPEEERSDALNYYGEYLDAAGPEAEEETIRRLGGPEAVAQKILEERGSASSPAVGKTPGVQRSFALAVRVLCGAILLLIALLLVLYLLFGLHDPSSQSDPSSAANAPGVAATAPAAEAPAAEGPQTDSDPSVEQGSPTATEDADWTMEVDAAAIQKLEIHVNAADFELCLDPQAQTPSLCGRRVEQSLVRMEYSAGKLQINNESRDTDPSGLLVLTLPETGAASLQEVEVDSNAGELTLPSLALGSDGELELYVNAGAASLGDIEAGDVDLKTNAGKIEAGNITARAVDMNCNAGKIETGAVSADEIDLETVAGSILASPLTVKQLDADADAGEIDVTIDGAPGQFSFEGGCTMGTIHFGEETLEGMQKRSITGSTNAKVEASCKAGKVTIRFTN